ncbi:MAG: dihydrokaempferol 4-reductase [Rhodobacteraceae bacterium]|nr:dihydrokaempferol 4-reductase [Paracoccaceae bacterium]MAY46912.1 dihydrokaempferol 4-reductase [Paracoccaceae bacterium]
MTQHCVLVTGATGYIARHIILQLLEAGHSVVGSVRSLASELELRAALGEALAGAGADPAALERLRLVELDLNADAGWDDAMAGVDVLMHTASPVPDGKRIVDEAFVTTAIGGTMRAVHAAYAAGVRRFVVTSSVAAIAGAEGHEIGEEFDESDWSDPDRPNLNAYTKSKTLAERALWDWNKTEAPDAEVTAINPSFVMGPPIGTGSVPSSLNIVARLLAGTDPALPDLSLPFVDVRDVARMHVLAMDLPQTVGKRYISSELLMSFMELSEMLRELYPDRSIPHRMAPKFVMRLVGIFKPEVRGIVANWGRRDPVSNLAARRDMGIEFSDTMQAIRQTAAFLVANDLVDG